jgi:hypothetical protein
MEMVCRMNIQAPPFTASGRGSAIGRATSLNFPREITETALAHVTGDKAEQAYRRSDALEKRRKLMDAWAAYCEPRQVGKVIPLTRNAGYLTR